MLSSHAVHGAWGTARSGRVTPGSHRAPELDLGPLLLHAEAPSRAARLPCQCLLRTSIAHRPAAV